MTDEFPLYQRKSDGTVSIQQYAPAQCTRCTTNDRSVFYRDVFTSDALYIDSNATFHYELHKLCDSCYRFRTNLVWG